METVLIQGNTSIILFDVISQEKIGFVWRNLSRSSFWYLQLCCNLCEGFSKEVEYQRLREKLGYVMLT